jgi:hypothetical protein
MPGRNAAFAAAIAAATPVCRRKSRLLVMRWTVECYDDNESRNDVSVFESGRRGRAAATG